MLRYEEASVLSHITDYRKREKQIDNVGQKIKNAKNKNYFKATASVKWIEGINKFILI